MPIIINREYRKSAAGQVIAVTFYDDGTAVATGPLDWEAIGYRVEPQCDGSLLEHIEDIADQNEISVDEVNRDWPQKVSIY